MPSFLVPRHVSAHRIAAIALYRSLLRQCRAAPVQLSQQDELQNVVRNRFKQTQHLHSYPRLKIAFQAGYEAIDYLDASIAGDEESTTYLTSLLVRAKPKIKAAPPVANTPRIAKSPGSSADKPSDAIFARPQALETLSGKRHVPVLFNATGIPVLRIKKPQPESLSGYIKNRLRQHQNRWNLRHWLDEQIKFAKYEDEWDELLAEEEGIDVDEPDLSWAQQFEHAKTTVVKALAEAGKKNQQIAERMQAVVDREQALADEERNVTMARKKVDRLLKANAKRFERES